MTTTTPTRNEIHSYYNTLVTSSFLNASGVDSCDELLDSGRCGFDNLGNVTSIDGHTITSRDGATFTFSK